MDQGTIQSELIERMSLGLVIWRLPAGDASAITLVAANPAAERLSQLPLRDWVGQTWERTCPLALERGRHVAYAEVLASGRSRPLDAAVYPELGASAVFGSMQPFSVEHVAVLFDDASNRSAVAPASADDALGKVNVFLDSIVDNIPAMVFVKDAKDLRYELFNRAGELLTGRDRASQLGRTDHELFPQEQADFFRAKDRDVLRDGKLLDIPEEPISTPAGQRWLHTKKIPILSSDGTAVHLLGISLDITEQKLAVEALAEAHRELERRVAERTRELSEANALLRQEVDERRRTQEALDRTEEQLRHSQKMEAVGRLAGGIAHDFNNLLSVILSYSAILSQDLSPDDPLAEGLGQIGKASERAADLTRQLLAFSRQQVLAPRVVDLNEIIDGMSRMLRRVIGEDVELEIASGPWLGRTKADPGQLEQVIMNLVVNARDAMPHGGRLTIETSNVELNEAYTQTHEGVAPGSYVRLSVSDTGVGMDKTTLGRAFEPFFTTKKQGQGSGLGLSTVFGIVKQSGGHISAESEPLRGSSFRLYFARTEAPISLNAPAPVERTSARGTETVLLVEDEEQVRVIARDILKARGYLVLDAGSPRDALEISALFSGDIHLLVTDIVMPEMNGKQLSEKLLAERPSLKVLFMSGYSDRKLDGDGVLGEGARFLQKPLTPASLASAVRQTLDGGARRV